MRKKNCTKKILPHMYRQQAGQIPQLFIFLAAILVIGATIVIGMKLFSGLKGTACEANDVTFQREVKNLINERITLGSRGIATLSPPCDAIALCFVDAGAIEDESARGNIEYPDETLPEDKDKTILASVKAGSTTNIFLRQKDRAIDAGYDERIILRKKPTDDPSETILCIPLDAGEFKFKTQGFGRFISFSKPS